MKYRDLNIQTQREAPNNARSEGFAFLVRAGYLTRENIPTPLGELTLNHLRTICGDPTSLSYSFERLMESLSLQTIGYGNETFFPLPAGSTEVAHCPDCGYTERLELAHRAKMIFPPEEQLPLEKIWTPDCHTIEALAAFLDVPTHKTAKALMYTRIADNKFIFVVVRGDMQLNEAKLKQHVGEVRPATAEEIETSGAAPGYASPIGLKNILVVADDLIPQVENLVAGANETGYHFKNTNYRRDYSAEIVEDLIQVKTGDPCPYSEYPLTVLSAVSLATRTTYDAPNILLALAETHHDAKGLTLPHPAAPFEVYLLHVPGKEIDTCAKAEEIYNNLQTAGIRVLFDDRDERAGVKFNDADLMGCPIRAHSWGKGAQRGNGRIQATQRKRE